MAADSHQGHHAPKLQRPEDCDGKLADPGGPERIDYRDGGRSDVGSKASIPLERPPTLRKVAQRCNGKAVLNS